VCRIRHSIEQKTWSGRAGIATRRLDRYIKSSVQPSERERFMNPLLVPGAMVRHPTQPDWGVGHVQSVIGARVTVNFEEEGKVLINAAVVELQVIGRERPS
jgi:transcription elongation factor GreA-like protein